MNKKQWNNYMSTFEFELRKKKSSGIEVMTLEQKLRIDDLVPKVQALTNMYVPYPDCIYTFQTAENWINNLEMRSNKV